MAKSISPVLGVNLNAVNPMKQTALGIIVKGDDGHDYIYAQASAAIAANTVTILAEPAMTMAAGAGAWTNQATALSSGDKAWFKRTAA